MILSAPQFSRLRTLCAQTTHFHHVVEIASRADFASTIQRALVVSNAVEQTRQRRLIAQQNTWEHRVEEIVRLIQLYSRTS